MNDSFSFDCANLTFRFLSVPVVNLDEIAGDRRQNLKPEFAQVPEQSDFTYSVYLVTAGHLQRCPAVANEPVWVNSCCSGT